jgi:putative oxidoreductase
MAAHGYNKFFGGGRIKGTAGWFESIGMKPGTFHARMAASTEMAAGIGLAVGLLTPVTAAGFVALMLAARGPCTKNGFFIVKEGWEYNLILAAAVAIAAIGAGKFSLDYALFRNYSDIYPCCTAGGVRDRRRVGPGRRHRPAGDLLPAAGRTGGLTSSD